MDDVFLNCASLLIHSLSVSKGLRVEIMIGWLQWRELHVFEIFKIYLLLDNWTGDVGLCRGTKVSIDTEINLISLVYFLCLFYFITNLTFAR